MNVMYCFWVIFSSSSNIFKDHIWIVWDHEILKQIDILRFSYFLDHHLCQWNQYCLQCVILFQQSEQRPKRINVHLDLRDIQSCQRIIVFKLLEEFLLLYADNRLALTDVKDIDTLEEIQKGS